MFKAKESKGLQIIVQFVNFKGTSTQLDFSYFPQFLSRVVSSGFFMILKNGDFINIVCLTKVG